MRQEINIDRALLSLLDTVLEKCCTFTPYLMFNYPKPVLIKKFITCKVDKIIEIVWKVIPHS